MAVGEGVDVAANVAAMGRVGGEGVAHLSRSSMILESLGVSYGRKHRWVNYKLVLQGTKSILSGNLVLLRNRALFRRLGRVP